MVDLVPQLNEYPTAETTLANRNANFYQPIQIKPLSLGMAGSTPPTTGAQNLSLAGGSFDPNFMGSSDQLKLGADGIDGGEGGFDFSNGMKNFSLGAQGITGLAGAYSAWQQMRLQKEQLALQRGFSNRDIANRAITTNKSLANQADLAAQLTTGAEYGTAEHLAAKDKLYNPVDGSPI